jgi:hypothetical protein
MDAEYSKYVDVEIEVPDCDRSTEEIARLEHMREPRTLVYVPPELTTPEGLLTLGRMFSGLDAMSAMRSSVSESGGGWIDIESRAEPPHEPRDISGFSMDQRLKLLTSDAEGAFRRNGVSGQRLATYIIGSEMNNVLTGRHFDRGGRSLLLGTRINGEVIEAHTGSINSQVHLDLEPTGNGTVASGWRSEGRKRE